MTWNTPREFHAAKLFTSFTRSFARCVRALLSILRSQIYKLLYYTMRCERWWQPRISRLVVFQHRFVQTTITNRSKKGKKFSLQICHSFYLPRTAHAQRRRCRDLPTANLDRFWEYNPILCTHHKKMITRAAHGDGLREKIVNFFFFW